MRIQTVLMAFFMRIRKKVFAFSEIICYNINRATMIVL